MNKILVICLLFLSLTYAKGQYVLIPDSNFRHALINLGFASCFDTTLTMLDTTCSSVLAADTLNIQGSSISSIEGVQYFKNLTWLSCSDNPLYTISQLPSHLAKLYCNLDHLTGLPALPSSLTYLFCSDNQIDSMPYLSDSITYLNMTANHVSYMQNLPASLQYLDCYENHLDSLPPLPNQLNFLNCGLNPFVKMPILPASLRTLDCPSVAIDTLPMLPDSLTYLDCSYDQLTALRPFPSALRTLLCQYNQLATFPSPPPSLLSITCNNNLLMSLPTLPDSLNLLNCSNNPQLSCLPLLHTIVTLDFTGTAIVCVPNGHVYSSTPTLSSLPLCAPNSCYALGVRDVSDANTISLYPNPNRGSFTLSSSNVIGSEYTISDMLGDVIAHDVITAGEQSIELKDACEGVYTLVVKGAQPVRFVIVR